MPIKTKKASTPKETPKEPVKKFVVEETTDTITEDKTAVEEQPEASKSEDVSENTPPSITEKNPEDDLGLKSDSEKDTLPSTNLTSFSLLDSDKKEPEEKTDMQDNTEEKTENTAPAAQEDTTLKSSQDEVNKWIENYDEKETTEKKKGSGFFRVFLIILTVLSLIAVIVGGIFYYQKNIAGESKEEAEETQTTEAPTATPTEKPKEETKVDYSKYSLQILNGSGVPGEAGKAKDLISDLEFDSVATANASSYDFEKTTVALKEGIPSQIFTDVKKLLGDTYDLESKSELLEDSSKYDVVITVGVRK